ncbi:L-fuco-beta-pyranose dehydrogenase [Actinomycetales bacterium JB111]|nr:L-fuco-beta-pyranose dehydrogenase [Actinomycetales bacterium JB111]
MATHLITGAGSGIGLTLGHRLLDRGDDLVLVARSAERADELEELLPGSRVLVADLDRPSGIEAALGGRLPERLDSLVHVAGVVDLGNVADLPVGLLERQLAVNVAAPTELTRLALPALRAARGAVVFVNSGAGLHANPGWSAYAASKHALRAVADSLRAEESPNGVRVTSIYPGRTATPMQARVHEQEGKDYDPAKYIDPDTVASTILTALDLPSDGLITDLSVRPGV